LSLEAGGPVGHVRWSPNGKQLAAQLFEDGVIKIWDTAAGYEFARSPAYRLERAQFVSRRGGLDEAKALLEKWMVEYPGDKAYRATLLAIQFDEGCTQLIERDVQRAVAAFTDVLRLDQSAGVYSRRGETYSRMGEFDKALADYSEAIRLDPKSSDCCRRRGEAYYQKHDFERTIADFEKAIELQQEEPALYNDLAWLLVTCPERRVWKPARAVELAKKATERELGDAAFWNTLGAAQYRAGDHEAAIKTLGKSMELPSGEDARNWFFFAMAHWQLKHTEEARRWYDKGAAWMEKDKSHDEELLRFRAEAADLLGITAKPPAGKEKPEQKRKAESGKRKAHPASSSSKARNPACMKC
jgi:tetratricopeptide (TPR) repeat protein